MNRQERLNNVAWYFLILAFVGIFYNFYIWPVFIFGSIFSYGCKVAIDEGWIK